MPVVICTSKTKAETLDLRGRLGNRHPFIVENGGAAFVPEGYFGRPIAAAKDGGFQRMEFGRPYRDLVFALRVAVHRSGCHVRAFHAMTVEEVASHCGLSLREATHAKQRDYDEPFQVLEPEREQRLLAALKSLGMRWTQGDKWRHITGNNDKAAALGAILTLFRRNRGPILTIGLGDSPNDANFLRMMDVPCVIRSRHVPAMTGLVPGARFTTQSGAAGWNAAVLGLPWDEWFA